MKCRAAGRINSKGSIDIYLSFWNSAPRLVRKGKQRVIYRLIDHKMKAPFHVEVFPGVVSRPTIIVQVVIPVRGRDAKLVKSVTEARERMEVHES